MAVLAILIALGSFTESREGIIFIHNGKTPSPKITVPKDPIDENTGIIEISGLVNTLAKIATPTKLIIFVRMLAENKYDKSVIDLDFFCKNLNFFTTLIQHFVIL